MATYRVEMEDGSIAEVEGPEGASSETLQAFLQENVPGARFGASSASDAVTTGGNGEGIKVDIHSIDGGPPVEEDQGAAAAGARGFGDVATFGLLDELGGVADALGATDGRESIWNSNKGFGDLVSQNISTNRSILEGDEAEHPVARGVGQLLGGLAIPTGMSGVAFAAGKEALLAGATIREARAIAAQAATRRLAGEGAAIGGAYGAGSADGGAGERLSGAGIGAAAGAAGGAAFGAIGGKVASGQAARAAAARAAPVTAAKRFTDAAERQGIDYLAADIPNATKSQFLTSLSGITLGGIPIAQRAEQTIASAKAARDRIAQGLGLVSDETGAGQAAQKGARDFIKSSEQRGGQLYEAIPIPPERLAPLTNTRAALGQVTQGLESNPKLSRLVADNPRFKAFLDAVTPETTPVFDNPGGNTFARSRRQVATERSGGELSWQDLKRFRTTIGEIVGQPSLGDDGSQNAAMRRLYAGLSEDMAATAEAVGPSASRAFRRANDYWRGRQDRVDNVLSDILGGDLQKGAQPAFAAIERLGKRQGGDATKLMRLMRSLPEDEASTVRATVLSKLGQVSAGRQDVGNTVFSPADFATHWNKLSDRAQAMLFQGDHLKAIKDVAQVADGMKQSGKFANVSKTSIGSSAIATMSSAYASPFLPVLFGALQFGGGKILSSPRAAQWVAAAVKKPNPKAQLVHVERLAALARNEPAIAQEALQLQQRLASAFTASPAKLAAEEGDNGGIDVQRNDEQ